MIKAVLFDLDGTIINSEEGITKCVQYALSSFGIEEPDRKKLLCFIGPPLDPVFREKYGFDADKAWQAVLKYRERFDKTGIFECELYEGVADTIRKLKEAGCVIALASSKPETACRRILEHFSLTPYFDEIVGSTLDGSISTKQQVLEELGRRMEHMQITKDQMCLIGDTEYDVDRSGSVWNPLYRRILWIWKRELLERAGAYCVCDNMAEVVDALQQM